MRLLARFLLVPLGIGCAVTASLIFLMVAATVQPALGRLFAGLSLASLFAFLDALTATGNVEAAPRSAR